MSLWVPDHYQDFRCLAADCPHSCCGAGWAVMLDAGTAARYAREPGAIGEKLRAHMDTLGGEPCFLPDEKGRCPFWNEGHLCDIHIALGADATSETCRMHPRFIEISGARRELTLSASCPAACELLLGSEAPLSFVCVEPPEGTEEENVFLTFRDALLTLVNDGSRPFRERLMWLLLLANEAQSALDDGDEAALIDLAEAAGELPAALPELPAQPGLLCAAVELLAALPPLHSDWPALLRSCQRCQGDASLFRGSGLTRIAAYFLWRYVPHAQKDGDLLSRAEFAVLAVLMIEALAGEIGLPEALRRFSEEVEHSEGALKALLEAFQGDERFSLAGFVGELGIRNLLDSV